MIHTIFKIYGIRGVGSLFNLYRGPRFDSKTFREENSVFKIIETTVVLIQKWDLKYLLVWRSTIELIPTYKLRM